MDRDSPTGETSSSPRVATSRISAAHSTGTEDTPTMGRKIRNADPIRTMPRPNLAGVDGCRSPSRVHSTANTGASRMMKKGLKDCTQEIGMVQSPRVRSSRVSE